MTRAMTLKLAAATGVAVSVGVASLVKKAGEYSVVRGDTLSGIAKRNNTTVGSLTRLNGITDPNRLSVGQRLKLPAPPVRATPAPVQKPAPASPAYRVRPVPTPAAATPVTPRAPFPGKRNNPGNMRYYKSVNWKGSDTTGLKEGDFLKFQNPQDAARAMIRNIMTLAKRTPNQTLEQIVPLYSPKGENNVSQHTRNISRLAGIRPNQRIDFSDDNSVANVAYGFIGGESGQAVADWYKRQELLNAVRRARTSS